jgi:hypothetical protein
MKLLNLRGIKWSGRMDLNHRPPGPEPKDKFTKSWLWRHLQNLEQHGNGQLGQP